MNQTCDFCREQAVLRPVCVKNRDEIPLLCSECTSMMYATGRFDRDRDAEEFGYSQEAIKERLE